MHHIVFILGLDDKPVLYRWMMPFWWLRGYTTHILPFGWKDRTAPLAPKQQRVLDYIDTLSGLVYVVGISAGGTIAVNALKHRPQIAAIATVASPLVPKILIDHPLLVEAQAEADGFLRAASPQVLAKISSLFGMSDERVPPAKSQPAAVRSICLPTKGHVMTIAYALTVYSGRLSALLRQSSIS